MGERVVVSEDTGWHGQVLGTRCDCGGPVMVDQHFCRLVCLQCWRSTSFGGTREQGGGTER